MKVATGTCVSIGATAFAVYLGIHYWPKITAVSDGIFTAATPLLVGAAAAYVINILMSLYERRLFSGIKSKSMKRALSIVLALLSLAAGITVLVRLVVPQLGECFRVLIDKLPGALETALEGIERNELLPDDIISELESIDWNSRIDSLLDTVSDGISDAFGVIAGLVTQVVSAAISAVLALIFAIYLLVGKEQFGAQFKRVASHYMKESWYTRLEYVVGVFDDCFHKFIVGQCTEAVILGVLCVLGMLLLRLPYATMIGALLGFMALVPIVGSFIATVIGAFMIFTVSPAKALIFIIFEIVIQQIEGNVIYPKVVGSSIGLPAIWVLTAVTIGGGVFGVTGLLLGVPLTSAIYRIIGEDIKRPKREKA